MHGAGEKVSPSQNCMSAMYDVPHHAAHIAATAVQNIRVYCQQ